MDSGFEVQWCVDCPVDEAGDCYPDQGDYKTQDVETLKEARKLAFVVLPLDFFGQVSIRPFYEDSDGFRQIDWENVENIS
jgi:hypothetical protein